MATSAQTPGGLDGRGTGERLQLSSARVLLDGALEPALLTIEDGCVVAIESGRAVAGAPASLAGGEDVDRTRRADLGDLPVCPAPLDLHLHGAGGVCVPPDGDLGELDAAIVRACQAAAWSSDVPADARGDASRGQAPGDAAQVPYSYVATLPVPADPPVDVLDSVHAAARALAATGGRTRCVGLRIEGLFLNPQHAGVWPRATFRHPDLGLFAALLDACTEAEVPLLVLDVAPELPGALELIELARASGVVVSLAHTAATYAEARRGIDAGATLATHTWNAMRPLHHRDPGVVGAILTDPRVTCELICDGAHVHPAVLSMTFAAKGPGGVAAVSDASPVAHCPDGVHEWHGMRIMAEGGILRDAAGNLAGSGLLLTHASSTLAAAGVPLAQRLVAISASPRRVLDPSRPLGLVVGDAPWVVGEGSLQHAS